MSKEAEDPPLHVLCVDDHEVNRQVIKEMLGVAGVSVDEAGDADSAAGHISLNEYDLVLMDLRMPGKDGLTAIREIRARGDAKGLIPVLVVTGDSGARIRCEVEEAGGDGLLFKPVVMNQLFEAIAGTLAAHAEKRTVRI